MTLRIISVCLMSLLTGSASAQVVGQASTIDGDTIEIQGARIRLHGIDAPESSQTCLRPNGVVWRCGQAAALALADRIGDNVITCEQRDVDVYGRIVAICSADGEPLNEWLVSNGWATAYTEYSVDYIDEQSLAERAGVGIWAGEFVPPALFRWGDDTASAVDRECQIKGNINGEGEKIYHVPSGQFYANTVVDTADGERWFCSEAEAVANGWRAARR